MAAKTPDYTKAIKDLMAAFPVDTSAFQDAFKSQAELTEKLSAVVFAAAASSNDVTTALTKDTLAGLSKLTTAKPEISDYFKSVSDFLTAQNEVLSGHLTSYGEIAKKAQTEATELLMAAGKTYAEDAQAAVKKAQGEVAKLAKAA